MKGVKQCTQKKILITGAGSGFGKLIALTLAKMDYSVIATTETKRQAALLEEDARALRIPLYFKNIICLVRLLADIE